MNTQNKNPNQSAQKYENLQRFARNLVEDAKNGKDLLNRIQKMKLLRKFTLDRENDKRIRFKGTDCWGNVSYLEIIR